MVVAGRAEPSGFKGVTSITSPSEKTGDTQSVPITKKEKMLRDNFIFAPRNVSAAKDTKKAEIGFDFEKILLD